MVGDENDLRSVEEDGPCIVICIIDVYHGALLFRRSPSAMSFQQLRLAEEI